MPKLYLVLLVLPSLLTAQSGFVLPRAAAISYQDVTVSPTGDRILAGTVSLDTVVGLDFDPGPGEVRFAGVTKKDPGTVSYLAAYASDDRLRFAIQIGDTSLAHNAVRAHYVDTDSDGNIYVQGSFALEADFGGPGDPYVVTSGEVTFRTFLASYTPEGKVRFVNVLPDYTPIISATGRIHMFGVDGAGNSYSLIGYSEPFDYDPGEGEARFNGERSVIASYDRDGNYRFAFETFHAPYLLNVAKMGDFYLVADYRSVDDGLDLDPQPESEYFLPETEEALQSVVVTYTGEAELQWVQPRTDPGLYPFFAGGDRDGNVYLGGPINPGAADFDFGPDTSLLVVDSAFMDSDIYLAKYTRTGELVKAVLLEEASGSFALETVQDWALNEAGTLYLSGSLVGDSLDLDPGPGTTYVGGQDLSGARAFVAGYDADLKLRFGYALGDTLTDRIGADGIYFNIAADQACGGYYLLADLALPQTVDFGPGPDETFVPTPAGETSDTVGLTLIRMTDEGAVGSEDCMVSSDREADVLLWSLTAYPNPAPGGQFTLGISSPIDWVGELSLYATDGRRLSTRTIEAGAPTTEVNLSAYPAGLYFARLRTPSGYATARLVVGR